VHAVRHEVQLGIDSVTGWTPQPGARVIAPKLHVGPQCGRERPTGIYLLCYCSRPCGRVALPALPRGFVGSGQAVRLAACNIT